MKNFSRNTTAVLVLTLFTGLAVFSVIQLGGRLFGTPAASAQAATSQAQSQSAGNGAVQGSLDPSGQNSTDPYGQSNSDYGQNGSSSGDSSGGQTYTCPATGCTASTCHATQ